MKCAQYARVVRLKNCEDLFLEHLKNYEGDLFENPLIPFQVGCTKTKACLQLQKVTSTKKSKDLLQMQEIPYNFQKLLIMQSTILRSKNNKKTKTKQKQGITPETKKYAPYNTNDQ
jgi:hypothetical protein